jgi:two-component system cell cycle response regulator DivK
MVDLFGPERVCPLPAATVLIIEDNPLSQEMAVELLEMAGFKVLVASDAETGIQTAKAQHPELILMDLHLPGKSGYDATTALKADPDTHDIVIIGFTAYVMAEEQERAKARGCAGVISKPIDVDRFAQMVGQYLPVK